MFTSFARLVLGGMLLLSLIHIGLYYPALPERVATHFGMEGRADGWMTKSQFAIFYVCLTGFMTLTFLGIGKLIEVTPNDLINLPNRDYWLAPGRRAATIAAISSEMAWFGVAIVGFMICVMHLSMQATLTGSNRLDSTFFWMFGGFMAFVVIWLTRLFARFRVR
jgi:uncharacterized membrane protein